MLPVSTPSSTTSTSPGKPLFGFLPADVDVRDEGELADQRSGEKDAAERDFVEVPEFAAARGECKHSHRGDGQDKGEGVHSVSQGLAPEVRAIACGRPQLVEVRLCAHAWQRPMLRDDVDEGGANGRSHWL